MGDGSWQETRVPPGVLQAASAGFARCTGMLREAERATPCLPAAALGPPELAAAWQRLLAARADVLREVARALDDGCRLLDGAAATYATTEHGLADEAAPRATWSPRDPSVDGS